MKNYNELVRELDSGGAHYSQELSEVDLSDSEDVKVLAADANGEVLVHLGSGNYLQRYKTYVTHVQQWRQQFEKLESVDLALRRPDHVNPDLDGMARQPALTPAAAKAAMAAGVENRGDCELREICKRIRWRRLRRRRTRSSRRKLGRRPQFIMLRLNKLRLNKRRLSKFQLSKFQLNKPRLKTKVNEAPVAAAKNTAVLHPATPSPAAPTTPVAVPTSQKKPSAGIRRNSAELANIMPSVIYAES